MVYAACVTTGIKYLDDCPKESMIPVYLLVGGGLGALKLMSLLYRQMKLRQLDRMEETETGYQAELHVSDSTRYSEHALTFFMLIWFVFGNVWVFRIYKPEFDQPLLDPKNWCDKRIYMFAVAQIGITYCLMAVIALFSFILTLYHRIRSDSDPS